MYLLLEVLGLCTDARPEVRVGAIQTLFRTMQLYGATLSLETWDECLWKITFPLLDSITAEIRHHAGSSLRQSLDSSLSPEQAWDESKTLALQSIGSIYHDFLTLKIMRLQSFTKAWDFFVRHIEESVLLEDRSISAPALRCLEKAVRASSGAGPDLKPNVIEAWERVWRACDRIGGAILQRATLQSPASDINGGHKPFTQESLVAFVDVVRYTRNLSRTVNSEEWELKRLNRLMEIFKGSYNGS
jgi:hypothetical protein